MDSAAHDALLLQRIYDEIRSKMTKHSFIYFEIPGEKVDLYVCNKCGLGRVMKGTGFWYSEYPETDFDGRKVWRFREETIGTWKPSCSLVQMRAALK
jgi:hypothetical protein